MTKFYFSILYYELFKIHIYQSYYFEKNKKNMRSKVLLKFIVILIFSSCEPEHIFKKESYSISIAICRWSVVSAIMVSYPTVSPNCLTSTLT